MNKADLIFKQNILRIMREGVWDENPRPKYASDGTPAHSIFITQVFEEYDLQKGELPITQLRPVPIEKPIEEIRWIYQDQSNSLDVLEEEHGIKWWRPWDIGDGTIGQRYGATVAKWDLINQLLEGIKKDLYGRRHMISLWQYSDLRETEGLPPCAFQFLISFRKVNGIYLMDLTLTQRSSDYLVAGHINMIQYVALQMMIVQELNLWGRPQGLTFACGKFARFTQNLHIYSRHLEQAKEVLHRDAPTSKPFLKLNAEGKGFYDITAQDFELINYHPVKPQLKFDLGV
jgi:thymidylate synthase